MRHAYHPSLSRTRKGFNLIEAAIVLGVVGLVIGGIWVAASAVRYQHQLAETAKGILVSVQAVRSLYARQPCTVASTTLNLSQIDLGPVSKWPLYSSGPLVFTPLGPSLEVRVMCGTAYGNVIQITLGQGSPPYDFAACQQLNSRLGLKNPLGAPTPDGNFVAMGGVGSCISGMSTVSYYWAY